MVGEFVGPYSGSESGGSSFVSILADKPSVWRPLSEASCRALRPSGVAFLVVGQSDSAFLAVSRCLTGESVCNLLPNHARVDNIVSVMLLRSRSIFRSDRSDKSDRSG